jgi:hypothetical protein
LIIYGVFAPSGDEASDPDSDANKDGDLEDVFEMDAPACRYVEWDDGSGEDIHKGSRRSQKAGA